MASAEQKIKAVTAAEKRLATAVKRFERAESRVTSTEALVTARDEAAALVVKAQTELDWQLARPVSDAPDPVQTNAVDDEPAYDDNGEDEDEDEDE